MISAVVLTKNSEASLARTLESLSFCDEIIVIDDHSTDTTLAVAKKYNASITTRSLQGNFAAQRNVGLSNATHEWVLFIDSDEVVSKELQKEIVWSVETGEYCGYYVPRTDVFFGKQLQYGETANVRLLRLGQKGKGEWVRSVHEVWNIKGPTSTLSSPLLHYPHPTMTDFVRDIDWYSTLNAQSFLREGKRVRPIDILIYPTAKFIQNYGIRRGFLDGMQGAILAIGMSFHSFLTRGKMYLLQNV